MNNLNEIQLFRANLAKELNYDITKAQKVCDFIFDTPTEGAPIEGMIEFTSETQDGIYFIQPDKSLIHESVATDEQKKSSIAVGVRMGDKFANVVLHDVADGKEIELCTESCGTEAFFHDNIDDAVADYNGRGNTEDIRSALNPEIKLKDGEYIPALGELYLLFINRKAVNKALEEAGGEPMTDCYWSSSEYSSSNAWFLFFNFGYTWNYYKYNSYVVRPAVAV